MQKILVYILFSSLILFLGSCGPKVDEEFRLVPEDLNLYFAKNPDLKKAKSLVDSFYLMRDYKYAWVDDEGLNEHAKEFIAKLENEIKYDSSSIYKTVSSIHDLMNKTDKKRYDFSPDDSLTKNIEITLTAGFFRYAQIEWQGMGGKKLKEAGWNIEHKKENYVRSLDSLLKVKPQAILNYSPVYFQYNLLREKLLNYREIAGKAVLNSFDDESLKEFLTLTGDYSPGSNLRSAIIQFQFRHGLEQSGKVDAETKKALGIPLSERVDQIKLNIERSKWIPDSIAGDFLFINIPEYKLFVYNNNKLQWTCDVVVGTDSTATVVFNDYMEMIVFSPYWNLPKSIIENETVPKIIADRNYLESHNMEIINEAGEIIDPSDVNWNKAATEFPYSIRQKPGENNSLGKVKFLFPNSHSIYLHDTPAKSLFGETGRAFSHGCVRVSEPAKLAQYILRNQPEWTPDSIQKAMNADKETVVKVRPVIPVFIAYFTSWVDDKGRIHFRDDIYSHDAKLKRIMLL